MVAGIAIFIGLFPGVLFLTNCFPLNSQPTPLPNSSYISSNSEIELQQITESIVPKQNEASDAFTLLASQGYVISAPLSVGATAYCSCFICCGKTDGITYSGKAAQPWHTIAVDPEVIPIGTKIYIPEVGQVFEAQDIGGKIKGRTIDIFVEDHKTALQFGRKKYEVYLLSEPEPNNLQNNKLDKKKSNSIVQNN